ncbi:MAG: flagellar filament capping protein FliD [Gemmatirosa sp.]|nr:flagellar filament capping protein FliD [Gemmatirosa sp.]
MADPISSIPGVTSGVDWKSLVDQIITLDRRPAVKMESTITANTAKKTALEQFRTAMATLKTATDALKSGTAFDAFTATTAGADATGRTVAVAVAGAGAAPGTYSLNVTSLAQAQKTVGSVAFASSSTALSLTGRLVVGGQNVDIAAGDTLVGVRDKINLVSSTSNVQATIVAANADGTGQRLVLTGLKSGAANAFTAVDDAANTTSLTTALGLGATPDVLAQDAVVQIDGAVTVSRSSNSIADAIPGVTLTLSAKGTSTLTVARQDSAATAAVQGFVDAYNKVQSFVATQANDPKGALPRDSLLRGTRNALSQTVLTDATGTPADLSRLSSVGISLQKDGTLSFDATAWKAAYPARIDDVKKMLADRMGALSGVADDVTLPFAGSIDQRENSWATQSASLQRHVDDIDARLDKKRTALLLQYSRSEAMLGKLKSMGDSLTSQLAGLSSSNNN